MEIGVKLLAERVFNRLVAVDIKRIEESILYKLHTLNEVWDMVFDMR